MSEIRFKILKKKKIETKREKEGEKKGLKNISEGLGQF